MFYFFIIQQKEYKGQHKNKIDRRAARNFPCWHWVTSTWLLANERLDLTNAVL